MDTNQIQHSSEKRRGHDDPAARPSPSDFPPPADIWYLLHTWTALVIYTWTSPLGVSRSRCGVWMKRDNRPLFLSCRGAGERGGVPKLEGLWLL